MSFMNGSECSTSANPLSQFTKHAGEDRSMQYDRVTGNGPYSMGLRSNVRSASAEDQQMMANFQQGNTTMPMGHAGAFHMEAMRNEIGNIKSREHSESSGGAWAKDFRSVSMPNVGRQSPIVSQQHQSQGPETARWAAEFRQPSVTPTQQRGFMNSIPRFTPQLNTAYSAGSFEEQRRMANQRIVALDDDKWEEQFKQIEQEHSRGKEKVTDEDVGKTVDEEIEGFDDEQFENVWGKIRSQVFDSMEDMDGPAWDRDFETFTSSRPQYGDYQFEENNNFVQEQDPYAMGVELMDTGAKLSSAVLCFEAAVQKNPNHVDAWARLGAAQAQNEKEDSAVRALERCIQLDPGNLDALMYLAVSYTNEGYENAAYATLEKWIASKYPSIVEQARNSEPKLENEDRFQLHSRVTELFIRAAQLSPEGANIDADIQVGLGVLFYGSEEYAKAIDCFQTALHVRPDDPLLWNRLGATLANSDRSEEAIEAYHKALSLRPSFVRARFNLGVSCLNIGCYKEAAQHLLAALSLHEVDGPTDELLANQSNNLYETLRRVLMAMERLDLMEKVGPDMNLQEFRQYFEF